jgi:hypothetical protein
MNEHDHEVLALAQLAEERLRQRLIERAASEGLTPDEIARAVTLESNRRADREAEATRRERGQ